MANTVGVVDTTFARIDMAKPELKLITKHIPKVVIILYTVPGIKDIRVAAERVLEETDAAITSRRVGASPVDK
jgi:riboflavin synthase